MPDIDLTDEKQAVEQATGFFVDLGKRFYNFLPTTRVRIPPDALYSMGEVTKPVLPDCIICEKTVSSGSPSARTGMSKAASWFPRFISMTEASPRELKRA